jgi:protein-S-isoprenylcysteine O-methyltransferase Ste14
MTENSEKNLLLWGIRMIIYLTVTTAIIFLIAGDWGWMGAWWYVGLQMVNTIFKAILLVASHPELLEHRKQIGEGTPKWDKVLAPLIATSTLLISLICALGHRFGRAWERPVWLLIAALLFATTGHFITIFSMRRNAFFEGSVRIQDEYGHQVVTKGPYRWVRHPGYVGVTLYNIAVPVVMASLRGFVGVGLFLIVLVWRTAKEDRFLRESLPGYADYARQTRWRLVPGIW